MKYEHIRFDMVEVTVRSVESEVSFDLLELRQLVEQVRKCMFETSSIAQGPSDVSMHS